MVVRVRQSHFVALALALFSLLTAFALNFTRYHESEHADAIVPLLTSLYRWTPFFWQQDRFGMAVPLLALPIKSPPANLIVQNTIDSLLAFMVFGLLARYLLPRGRDWIVQAALALATFVAFAADNEKFDVFGPAQPYSASLAMALVGLELWRCRSSRSRLFVPIVLALLAIAEWINLAVMIPLVPLVIARLIADLAGSPKTPWYKTALPFSIPLAGFVVGALVAHQLGRHFGAQHANDTLLPITVWLRSWRRWAHTCWRHLRPHHWESVCAVLAVGGLLSSLRPAIRARSRAQLSAGFALMCGAVYSFLVMGTFRWVRFNGYPLRYALPSLVMANCALMQWACLPLPELGEKPKRWFSLAAPIVVWVAIVYAYGLPGPGRIEAAFDKKWGQLAREVNEAHATHVVGGYWSTWPVVFRANWLRHEQGVPSVVYGLAHRCGPTLGLARQIPSQKWRVALIRSDPKPDYLLLLSDTHWSAPEQWPSIEIVTPVD